MFSDPPEQSCPHPESLEDRLRNLPQPAVPAGLEARLLAQIPMATQIDRPRRTLWLGVVGASAAACLLVVLFWPRHDARNSLPAPETGPLAQVDTPPQRGDAPNLGVRLQAQRRIDETTLPAFAWPLGETPPAGLSTSIPPDLLQ